MAHLHLLLASESDAALLIKYGPGRATCTVGWDRSTDEFVAGQCLDARLQGADLSPDGKYLVYGVNRHRYPLEDSAYVAVSRAPGLEPLSFWGSGGSPRTCPIPGCFYKPDRARLELVLTVCIPPKWDRLGLATREGWPAEWDAFGHWGSNLVRLQRDGWEIEAPLELVSSEHALGVAKWRDLQSIHRATLRRRLRDGWALLLTYWIGIHDDKNRGTGFATFALVSPEGVTDLCDGWVSADFDAPRNRIVWTGDNMLFAAPQTPAGLGPPRLLYDASALRFSEARSS